VLKHRSNTARDDKSTRIIVPLQDGTMMACRDRGEGPAVLLVHGWAVDHSLFDGLADELSQTCRVLTPDLRAHGGTAAGKLPLTVETLAADLAELIEFVDCGPITALGWSMGATALWRMIELHGYSRLNGLIVEDMSPRILNDSDWSLGMANGLTQIASARLEGSMKANWADYARSFGPRMLTLENAAANPELATRLIALLCERDGSAMAQLWASMAQQDVRAALPNMKLPVLVTYGEQSDAYKPETADYLVSTLPEATSRGFARSGHAPHIEQPEEFARVALDFVERANATTNQQSFTSGSTS
jgi:pimeloyl-ACP methyl ester carboxylesterase